MKKTDNKIVADLFPLLFNFLKDIFKNSGVMKHLKVLFLSQDKIKKLLTINDAIQAVEYAFRMHSEKMVQMPPKIYLNFERYNGDLRTMPAYIEPLDASGVKIVNVHIHNKKIGLPTVMAVFVLVNPRTGAPLAVMDATYITDLRTGAAGAVATKYLARKDAKTLGLVGAGRQAELQLLAIGSIKRVKWISVCALTGGEAEKFAKRMRKKTGLNVVAMDIEDVCASEIISTTTPVRSPIVKNEWIKSGTHINAIGADAPGKQELEVGILKRSRLFVDDMKQAVHSGEVNVGLIKKQIKLMNIAAELCEVVTGKKKGRLKNSDITLFDSTGLALQDVVLAYRAYRKALKNGEGQVLSLF